jgi:hypothetical protein
MALGSGERMWCALGRAELVGFEAVARAATPLT